MKNLAEEDRIVLYAGANYSVTGKNDIHDSWAGIQEYKTKQALGL